MSLALDLSLSAGEWQIRETTVTLPATQAWTPLVTPNPLRWGIVFGLALKQNGLFAVSTIPGLAASAANGIQVTTSLGQTSFTYDQHGALPSQAWFGAANAAAQVVITVMEILCVSHGEQQ